MSEILTAIKLVKLYSWEKSFSDNVHIPYELFGAIIS